MFRRHRTYRNNELSLCPYSGVGSSIFQISFESNWKQGLIFVKRLDKLEFVAWKR